MYVGLLFAKEDVMRILGIDPGLATIGWGVIDTTGARHKAVAYGAIITLAGTPTEKRLALIFAELEAIIGSDVTIRKFKPRLLVSLYHRSRDVFFLPIYLMEKYPEYDFYIRRLYSVPAWELNLIMIPKKA